MPHELPGLKRISTTPDEGVYVVPSHDDIDTQKSTPIREIVFEDGEEVGLGAALRGEQPKQQPTSKVQRGKKVEQAQPAQPVATPPVPQTVPVTGYIVSVQTELGILEAEAVDVIDDKQKVFGICYDAGRRGNKIIPSASAGKMTLTVIDKATDEEAIYSVAPLGVSFTIPKSNLLVVLFEQVE